MVESIGLLDMGLMVEVLAVQVLAVVVEVVYQQEEMLLEVLVEMVELV
jgi:hypothetical protein